MSGSSLFRADDFLLKGALYLGVAVLMVLSSAAAAAKTQDWVVTVGLGLGLLAFTIAPIAMAVVGYRLRRREKRAVALWKIVDRDVEISVRDLLRDSDWTRPHLDRAVRDLNNSGVAYVIWDRKAGLIQDGRLRRSTLVVDECTSCSGKMSVQVTIGSLAAVLCPYCHEPIDVARIAEEKARLIDELESDRRVSTSPGRDESESGEFNVVLFIVLFTVFWPAGLWYCAKHRTRLASLIG